MGFNEAFLSVKELVNDFKENEKAYLRADYSEADVRNDFINKFFIALGWDVRHDIQKNPYEQEVRVEKPVQVAKAQKRADYTFYLEPNFRDVKFFVEAKKPFHDLINKDYFFQTVRYGWNANTPVAALTDFEELIILDCRYRPDIKDILNFKIKSFHYSDYANEDKFKEIYFLFSREAVADSSIEKYAANLPKPKGKSIQKGLFAGGFQSIDESFLVELDEIRTALAKSFKKNNTHLSSGELTEATQRTIDRLVFIKFLEDKMIEPHHYVSEFGNRRSAWEDFVTASITLDAKYNGVVFKKCLIDTKNIIEPDDKTFSKICEDLSHENTVYNFDAIPIHILGSIYERFLGKIVNATDKRVTIEEKPEVRKAGGVYYTPQYIVNYIVDNTIGKMIDGKKPKEIAKLRFADIACGSGSFLITVYERLLDYHKRWYSENPGQAKKDGCVFYEGAYRLSLKQKQKILTNNIYGVDLDPQAIQVTQLSLYLKLLEDETTATANDTWVMFKEKLLPDLSKNIVCGNSLIGTDILNPALVLPFAKGEETGGVGEVDELKLKPMDFETTFPEVFNPSTSSGGGFDAIVGNPPYGATFSDITLNYLKKIYHIQSYQFDSYTLFVEKALQLLKQNGLLGYIIPNTWLLNLFSTQFRKFVFENLAVDKIIHYKKYVFKQATVDTETIIINKKKPGKNSKIEIVVVEKDGVNTKYEISQNRFTNVQGAPVNIFERDEFVPLTSKMKNYPLLNEIAFITQGCKPFQVGKGKPAQTRKIVDEKPFVTSKKIDPTFRELLRGSQMNRYIINWNGDYWISFGDWLAEPRYSAGYDANFKIVIRQTGDSLIATLDSNQFVVRDNLYTIILKSNEIDHKYLLTIINSRLLTWFYQNVLNPEKGEALAQVKRGHVAQLPIPVLSDENKDIYQKLISLATQMLTAKKQLQQAKTESDKNYLERKCETLDRQIDQLVYQLYGLTEEEIKIVEEQ